LNNLELLLLATVCLAGSMWASAKKTRSAAAPTLLSLLMYLLALSGPAWEWSKTSGAALPPQVRAAAFDESEAVKAFLFAAIGSALAALLIPREPDQDFGAHRALNTRPISLSAAIASSVAFALFLIGSGTSILRRDVYLQNNGPLFILHSSWPFGIVFGVLGTVLIFFEQNSKLRWWLVANSVAWFVAPAAVGSRTACAVPLLAGTLIAWNELRKRRIHLLMIVTALALIVVTFFTFSAVNKARSMPHGILNMPNVAEATAADMIDSTDSVLLPVKQLLASVVVAFPDAEQSVTYGVDPDVLISNANPLPGTAQASELERYWPYEWVPLSFVGTWYGAMGWVAQMAVFGITGWILGMIMYNVQRSRFQLVAFLPLGFAGLIGVVAIEYPSRMVWRLVSMCLLLLIASYLVRDSTRYLAHGQFAQDEQPTDGLGSVKRPSALNAQVPT